MARGERIGDAYVRIHASGEGMDKEIRQMFDDQDPNFREGGRRNSKAYTEAFAREMGSSPNQTRLRRSLTDALAKGDFLQQEFFRSRNWTNFRSGLIKEFGDAGRLAGDNLESELLRGMTFDELDDRLDNITRDISNAQRQLAGANNETTTSINRLTKAIKEEGDEITKTDKEVDRHHNRLRAFTETIGKVGDRVGTMFGRGSRNDFLNFIGSIARGMVNLLQIVPRVALGLASIADNAREAFRQSILNGGSTFRATLAGIAAVAETTGAALIAVGIAMTGLIAIIGPLVALMSLLVGALTAIAGTVVFAAIGAIAGLTAVLLPLAAAATAVGVAFIGMTDAQKKALGIQLRPLTNEFKALGAEVRRGLFGQVGEQAKALRPVIEGLRPLFRGLGESIANVGTAWARSLDSPGFRAFRDTMERFLPSAVERLGAAIGNTFGGLGGIFRALTPLANDFLNWLVRITEEFSAWANTAQGQFEIRDFLDRAAESAKALGRFLLEAGDFLMTLLDAGRETGDSIFDRMANGLQRLTEWLDSHPDALSDWFDDAEELVVNIGRVINGVGRLVDALDNAGTRIAANGMVNIIARIFRGAGRIVQVTVDTIERAVRGLRRIFSGDVGARGLSARIAGAFTGLAGRIISALPSLPGRIRAIFDRLPPPARSAANRVAQAFNGVANRIAGLIRATPSLVSAILGRLPGIARNAATRVGSAFSGVIGRIRGFISGIPGMVSGIMSRLAGPARTAAQAIGSAFSGVVGRVRGFLDGLPGAMSTIGSRMVTAASSIPGQIASQFSGLASRIISAVGTIQLPTPRINMPNIPKINIPGLAAGGIETGYPGIGVIRRVAEAGPEAVVPLNRPLSLVDPSVRWLSAIAQGKIPAMANGGTVASGRSITIAEGAITVVSPSSDPRAVATQMLNTIVATGY